LRYSPGANALLTTIGNVDFVELLTKKSVESNRMEKMVVLMVQFFFVITNDMPQEFMVIFASSPL
jgi:hypothetical protein